MTSSPPDKEPSADNDSRFDATFIDSLFEGVTEHIDKKSYKRCTFRRTTLIYSATGPVRFVECEFQDARWHFDGPAANTLAFLRNVYHGMGRGGRELVEQTFIQIREPFPEN